MSCANCGKGEEDSNKLKTCTACLSVKYCSRECQAAHRPQHKKECKKRAAEIYDEKLFKEPPSPEDCPICMLTLPINASQSSFFSCCGKLICNGCIHAMKMSEGKDLCPFCRMPMAISNEGNIKRLYKLMDKGNADAYYCLGNQHAQGLNDIPQDWNKATELYLKAGELGCSTGYYNLGNSYYHGQGVVMNKKKAEHYFELAAMNGYISARNNLGCMEWEKGNQHRAMKHFILAAGSGHKDSLETVKSGFMRGLVTKDDYANTLRAYHERQKEMKSDERDKAAVSGWYSSV